MELHLDRKHADKRIFPAIDIERSGTRHDELLFSKEMLDNVNTLRRMLGLLNSEERVTVMIEKLSKTKDNVEFLKSLTANGSR